MKKTCKTCKWLDDEECVKPPYGCTTDELIHYEPITPTTGMMTAAEWYDKNFPSGSNDIFDYMTDYANYVSEIQAVMFGEWIRINRWKSNLLLSNGWRRIKLNGDGFEQETATTEQLYKKWKEAM